MKDLNLIEETLDFLECSIHTILYIRKIYPSALFEQRRYQNITVWQSRHPEINTYVKRVLENAKPLISQVFKIYVLYYIRYNYLNNHIGSC